LLVSGVGGSPGRMLDFDNAGVEIGCESEPIDVKQRARGFECK
jgi:hypothetical protein